MRVIPGMVVASPSDDIEAKAMVAAAYEHQGPVVHEIRTSCCSGYQ